MLLFRKESAELHKFKAVHDIYDYAFNPGVEKSGLHEIMQKLHLI